MLIGGRWRADTTEGHAQYDSGSGLCVTDQSASGSGLQIITFSGSQELFVLLLPLNLLKTFQKNRPLISES